MRCLKYTIMLSVIFLADVDCACDSNYSELSDSFCNNQTHIMCRPSLMEIPNSWQQLKQNSDMIKGLLTTLNKNRDKKAAHIVWDEELTIMSVNLAYFKDIGGNKLCLVSRNFMDVRSTKIQMAAVDFKLGLTIVKKISIKNSEIISNIGCSKESEHVPREGTEYNLVCLYNFSNRSTADELAKVKPISIYEELQKKFNLNSIDYCIAKGLIILVWFSNLVIATFIYVAKRYETVYLIYNYGD